MWDVLSWVAIGVGVVGAAAAVIFFGVVVYAFADWIRRGSH